MIVDEARARTVARLPSAVATTFHAMPESGAQVTIASIGASTGQDDTTTRQHLATLCALGLVSCDGVWCQRTKARGRRV